MSELLSDPTPSSRPPTVRSGWFAEPMRQVDAAPDGLHLRELLGIFRRRIWLVVGMPLLTGALAAYWIHLEPPLFSATAVLQLDDERAQITNGITSPDQAAPRGEAVNPLMSQLELLRSRRVIGRVV